VEFLRLWRFERSANRGKGLKVWWPRLESNQRHADFQSAALPTELLGRGNASRIPDAICRGRIISSGGLLEAVAEAAHGHDAHAARLELLAQAVHVDLDGVARNFLAPLAQVADELVLGNEASGALQEDFQQAHFARREFDRGAVQLRAAPDLVVGERAMLEQRRPARHAAARKRTHARLEFRELEGLGHVV